MFGTPESTDSSPLVARNGETTGLALLQRGRLLDPELVGRFISDVCMLYVGPLENLVYVVP